MRAAVGPAEYATSFWHTDTPVTLFPMRTAVGRALGTSLEELKPVLLTQSSPVIFVLTTSAEALDKGDETGAGCERSVYDVPTLTVEHCGSHGDDA